MSFNHSKYAFWWCLSKLFLWISGTFPIPIILFCLIYTILGQFKKTNIFCYGHNFLKKISCFTAKDVAGLKNASLSLYHIFSAPFQLCLDIPISLHERLSAPKSGHINITWRERGRVLVINRSSKGMVKFGYHNKNSKIRESWILTIFISSRITSQIQQLCSSKHCVHQYFKTTYIFCIFGLKIIILCL